MITVEDVIALALPSGTTVAAGGSGLGREVTWATRIRSSPPAFGHVGGGELVLLPVSVLPELDERLQLDGAVRRLAGSWTEELLGFWMAWHLYGGFEGLEKAGWHRATIFRKLKKFRSVFKMHPDDYKVVGVSIDHQAFWDHYLKSKPERES